MPTKQKKNLKTLLKNIDTGKSTFISQFFLEKTGKIKTTAFFQMLDLHQIVLDIKDKAYLEKEHSNGDQIKFKDAIAKLVIDLQVTGIEEKKWTVLRPTVEK